MAPTATTVLLVVVVFDFGTFHLFTEWMKEWKTAQAANL